MPGTHSLAVTSTRCSTRSPRRPRRVDRHNDNFEQFSVTPDKVLGADDNHVIVTVKVKGRTKRGTTIENRAVWIYQLRDGRIADAETFGDTAQVLQALG